MKEAEMSIPHYFRCPISLDLFKDPVTLCTGQTYDRSSIEKWLSAGNLTCPVTMQRLHDPSMVPNHTLRHLIDQWLKMGSCLDPDCLSSIESLSLLKHELESHEVSLEMKVQVLVRIKSLYQESPSTDSCLLRLGFLPLLLELVFRKVDMEPNHLSQEFVGFLQEALSCVLRLLHLGEHESLKILKEEERLESLLYLFEHGNTMIKCSLCRVIEAISSNSETGELCSMISKNRKLLNQIVLAIQQNNGTSEAAIRAISALCSLESNRENLVEQGVINALITYIESQKRSLAPMAMAIVELLLQRDRAKQEIIRNPDGIKVLVKMVFQVSDHEGSESAIGSLMTLCTESLQAREEAISAGVITQLLLLLQSQCSGSTKAKARMLLKLLRSKWDEELKHLEEINLLK